MASDVIMPQMGFDMTEGMVARWLKREGETVTRGEAIAEIETDKATVELEAYESGVMARILVPEGVTVPVGQIIGLITAPGEEVPTITAPPAPPQSAEPPPVASPIATPPPPPAGVEAPAAATIGAAPDSASQPAVTPVARRIAAQAGLALTEVQSNVTGTGPGGRITRGDVERYLETRVAEPPESAPAAVPPQAFPTPAPQSVPTPAPQAFPTPDPPPAIPAYAPQAFPTPAPQAAAGGGVGIVVPAGLPPMRQAIARRMSLSKLTAPHYYITVEIDMTRALRLRAEINEDRNADSRVTVNDLIIKAVAMSLFAHPHFNVTVQADGIMPNATTDVSIAVAMDGGGLIAPALPDVGSTSLIDIASRARDLSGRAREGRLTPAEISGVGFAVSNLGMYDVKDFVAIITPPNAGAIAVGSVQSTPVVRNGQIVVADIMAATLSADHRATDGAEGARFMNEVRRLLERPSLLLL